MSLRIFSWFCTSLSLFGIISVFRNPGAKDNVTLILFAVAMILMGSGFGQVSRSLSKLSRAPSNDDA
jgi:hypothetical protein